MLKDYFDKLSVKTQAEFFEEIEESLCADKKRFVVTANPETLMIGVKNPEFDAVLKQESTTIIADGIGVVKAAESLGIKMGGRVPGVELAAHLIHLCGVHAKSVYLFGAKEEVVQTLTARIIETEGDIVCGIQNGYVSSLDDVKADILEKQPDVILVALGIPKQELFIDRVFSEAKRGIFVGVGGSFDVLSGMKKRAPAFFVKLNLEWLYRILKEPARFKRFYQSNVRFLKEVKKIKKQKK